MYNVFIELAFSPEEGHFRQLRKNILRLYRQDQEEFENFSWFLGKAAIGEVDLLIFLRGLQQFLLNGVQNDPHIALVEYGRKQLIVCCPHIDEVRCDARYYVHGFNALPSEVCEGTGFRYWGDY